MSGRPGRHRRGAAVPRERPRLLFFVPLDRESSGGEVYARRVAEHLAGDFEVIMVETLALAGAVSARASRVLRRFAFVPWVRAVATAVVVAWRFQGHRGPVLQDYESSGATPVLNLLRRVRGEGGPVSIVHHIDGRPGRTEAEDGRHWRRRLRGARAVVVVSDCWARALVRAGVPSFRIHRAPPGRPENAPGAPRSPREGAGVAVLFVGNLQWRKGADVLVAAMAVCRRTDLRLVMVGDLRHEPACTEALREQISRAGLDSRVQLAGRLGAEELEARWAEADVFVLPSRMEGYGMVVAEAMLRGLPVIASRVGALPELVADGRTGLLVDVEDVAGLAAALERLAGDPVLRADMGAEARRRAVAFPTWADAAGVITQALQMA